MQTGTELANLVHLDFHTFSETVENIVYNLTILYGEKAGGIVLAKLTEFLANIVIHKKSRDLCDAMIDFLIKAVDTLVTKGAISFILEQSKSAKDLKKSAVSSTSTYLARGIINVAEYTYFIPGLTLVAESVGEVLGADAAKSFADKNIGKGKLAKKIDAVILQIEMNAKKEKLRNRLLQQKLAILNPEQVARERELKFIEADQVEQKRLEDVAQKQLAEQHVQKLAAERKQTLATSSFLTSPLRKMAYFASDATSAVVNAVVSTPSAIVSAGSLMKSAAISTVMFLRENAEEIAEFSGTLAGFAGTSALKETLQVKFGFNISDTQDFEKIEARRARLRSPDSAKNFIKSSTRFACSAASTFLDYYQLYDRSHHRYIKVINEAKAHKLEKLQQLDRQYHAECKDDPKNDRTIYYGTLCTFESKVVPGKESRATFDERITAERNKKIQERVGFTSDELAKAKLEQECFLSTYSETEVEQVKSNFLDLNARRNALVLTADEHLESKNIKAGVFVPCTRDQTVAIGGYQCQPCIPIISTSTYAFYSKSVEICEAARLLKQNSKSTKDKDEQAIRHVLSKQSA